MKALPQGTIVNVVWPHADGGQKTRFAVVLSEASACPFTEDMILVKLTSTAHDSALHLEGDLLRGTNLSHDTFVHTWSLNTIHLDHIKKRVGRLPELALRGILKAVSAHLGLSR